MLSKKENLQFELFDATKLMEGCTRMWFAMSWETVLAPRFTIKASLPFL